MTDYDISELIVHIDLFGKNLSKWEVDFIASLIDDPPEEYSEKQRAVIERIYEEKC